MAKNDCEQKVVITTEGASTKTYVESPMCGMNWRCSGLSVHARAGHCFFEIVFPTDVAEVAVMNLLLNKFGMKSLEV